MSKKGQKRLAIYVTAEQKQALRKLSYEQDRSISEIIRELIEKFLKE